MNDENDKIEEKGENQLNGKMGSMNGIDVKEEFSSIPISNSSNSIDTGSPFERIKVESKNSSSVSDAKLNGSTSAEVDSSSHNSLKVGDKDIVPTSNPSISNNSLVHHKPRTLPSWFKARTSDESGDDSLSSSTSPTSSAGINYMSSPLKKLKIESVDCNVTVTDKKLNSVPTLNSTSGAESSTSFLISPTSFAPVSSSLSNMDSPHGKIKVESTDLMPIVSNSDTELRGSISVGCSSSDSSNNNYDGPSSSHVDSSLSSDDISSSTNVRPLCQYGNACYRQNPSHRKEYYHPNETDPTENRKMNKPNCWYGPSCYRKNEDHLQKYNHNFAKRKQTVVTSPLRVTSEDEDEDTDFDEDFLNDFSSDEFECPSESGSETDFSLDGEDEENEKTMLKEGRKFVNKKK